MAVTKVIEVWKGQAAVNSADGAIRTRVFDVYFDSGPVANERAAAALTATDGTTAVPAFGTQHAVATALYVREKSASETGSPLIFRVTVTYRNIDKFKEHKAVDEAVNPLSRDAEVSYSFADEEVQIDHDIDGNAIVNSALETPDPPITKTISDLVIRIVSNESSYSPTTAMNYKNKLNSGSFMGFSAGLVKCVDYSAVKMVNDVTGGTYWQLTKEFQVRLATVGGVNAGWKKRILDQGFRELDGTDDNNKPKYKAVTAADDEGKLIPVSEPVLLNGSGSKLSDGGTPVWLEYDVYDLTSFSGLD